MTEAHRHGGTPAVLSTAAREVVALVGVVVRARATGPPRPRDRAWRRWRGGTWRWAWRGLRARGWAGVLAVGLVAVALAANALVFATADALVFHRVPYPDADRLIQIRDGRLPPSPWSFMPPRLLAAWSRQTDILAGIAAYGGHSAFVIGAGAAEKVEVADVTPGTFQVLGVLPRWGRAFQPSDLDDTTEPAVIVSETLARARFGEPADAIGQRLETTAIPLRIVGVMPRGFRFPAGGVDIWQPLDVQTRGVLPALARLAPGLNPQAAAAIIAARGPVVAREAGLSYPYQPAIAPLVMTRASEMGRRLSFLLLGAAVCLLLTACANVAGLELASAVRRARSHGIQLALGATRGALVRVAVLEAALLTVLAAGLAVGLSWLGTSLVAVAVPPSVGSDSLHAVSFDRRVFTFMAVVTGAVWLATALPIVIYASRASVVKLLRLEGRSQSSATAGLWARRVLTIGQVGLAVCLLVGSLLYTRTYRAMLAEDKGFDSHNLVSLDITIPSELRSRVAELERQLPLRIKALPGVLDLLSTSAPSESDRTTASRTFDVDGRPVGGFEFKISRKAVPANYFSVLRIPLVAGRPFVTGDPPTSVIVGESLARKFWPEGAVGHTFQQAGSPLCRIVGVVGHVRAQADGWHGPSQYDFLVYDLAPVGPDVTAAASANAGRGAPSAVDLTIRLDSSARMPAIVAAVRAMVSDLPVTGEFVDDAYAGWARDTLFATRLVSGFGGLSFLVAMMGVYSIMAFLVAGRTREMGIRMALGADGRAVRRLVLGSSLRLVVIGATLGLLLALGASRGVQAQLVGVTPTDPLTYAIVLVAVAMTAMAATWVPARRASSVDPAVTLRAE